MTDAAEQQMGIIVHDLTHQEVIALHELTKDARYWPVLKKYVETKANVALRNSILTDAAEQWRQFKGEYLMANKLLELPAVTTDWLDQFAENPDIREGDGPNG